jgi:hypothetical protein
MQSGTDWAASSARAIPAAVCASGFELALAPLATQWRALARDGQFADAPP